MLRRDGHVEIADVFLNSGELLEDFTDEYVGHWLPPVDANHRTSGWGIAPVISPTRSKDAHCRFAKPRPHLGQGVGVLGLCRQAIGFLIAEEGIHLRSAEQMSDVVQRVNSRVIVFVFVRKVVQA